MIFFSAFLMILLPLLCDYSNSSKYKKFKYIFKIFANSTHTVQYIEHRVCMFSEFYFK